MTKAPAVYVWHKSHNTSTLSQYCMLLMTFTRTLLHAMLIARRLFRYTYICSRALQFLSSATSFKYALHSRSQRFIYNLCIFLACLQRAQVCKTVAMTILQALKMSTMISRSISYELLHRRDKEISFAGLSR